MGRQPTYRHRTSLSVTSNNQRTLLNRRIPDSSSATTRPILRLADIPQHSPQDELENNLPVEAQEQERHYTSNSRLRAGARAFKSFEKQSAAGSQRALHSASAQYLPSQNSAHDLRASPPRSSTNPNDGRDSSASHPPSSSMTSESSSTSTRALHLHLIYHNALVLGREVDPHRSQARTQPRDCRECEIQHRRSRTGRPFTSCRQEEGKGPQTTKTTQSRTTICTLNARPHRPPRRTHPARNRPS